MFSRLLYYLGVSYNKLENHFTKIYSINTFVNHFTRISSILFGFNFFDLVLSFFVFPVVFLSFLAFSKLLVSGNKLCTYHYIFSGMVMNDNLVHKVLAGV